MIKSCLIENMSWDNEFKQLIVIEQRNMIIIKNDEDKNVRVLSKLAIT